MQVTTFMEYQAYVNKVRKEAEVKSRKQKEDRYDELFERYDIQEGMRHYVFYSDLTKPQDTNSIDFKMKLDKFKQLANRIPELALEAATPTYADQVKREVRREVINETKRWDAINHARNPFIEKQLEEMKPRFEEENRHLSVQDLESAWTIEVQK